MKSWIRGGLVIAVTGCVVWDGASIARAAETMQCTPVTGAMTITTPGRYCLTQSITVAASPAIRITANDVTLDLGRFTLTGVSTNVFTTVGIDATGQNVTVRNGTVRKFGYPLRIEGNVALVEDLVVSDFYIWGVSARGEASIVRNNRVVGAAPNASGISGIVLNGSGIVSGNQVVVSGPAEMTSVIGINTAGLAWRAEGNQVVLAAGGSTRISWGMQVAQGTAVGNVISGRWGKGLFVGTGTFYANNTVLQAATAYEGGTRGANNTP